jgi:uncharacterized membrane protein
MIAISGPPGALRDYPMPRPARWEAVDALRGVVMVLMALDHVRVYFTDTHFSPTDLTRTTAALFFTRWVTHFCAFFLLAGLGASLFLSRGKTRSTLAFYLVTRGLWLIVLEVTVVSFAWTFDFTPTVYGLGVIWALGCSMVVLGGLVNLPRALIAAFAVLLIVGHNLFDGLRAEDLKAWGPLWAVLHTGEDFALTSRLTIDPYYPLVPWVGVMALGYALGPILEKRARRPRQRLLGVGIMMNAVFVLLRLTNAYGDPGPWSAQPSALVTALSFLNTTKYPPSLLFLLMTLGPTLMALALFDRIPGLLTRFYIVFGRVPLFFYVVHLYWIHGLAVGAGYLSGFDPRAFLTLLVSFPQEYGFSLPVVYGIWIGVVMMLYPMGRWYGAFKASRPYRALAYL